MTYNTFGGTSTDAVRLWASVFTPDSAIPLPVPFPLFHWDSTPLVVGRALNAASFVPAAVLTPLPPVAAIVGALNALASAAPELRAGSGDLLVADTRARLPFAASHATNALNHLEALSDHGLQSQVSALLLAQRNPLVSGVAIAKLSPFPAKQEQSHQYRVVASDAGTGASLTPGVVTIRDGVGNLTLTLPPGGAPFKYQTPQYRLCGRSIPIAASRSRRRCGRLSLWNSDCRMARSMSIPDCPDRNLRLRIPGHIRSPRLGKPARIDSGVDVKTFVGNDNP